MIFLIFIFSSGDSYLPRTSMYAQSKIRNALHVSGECKEQDVMCTRDSPQMQRCIFIFRLDLVTSMKCCYFSLRSQFAQAPSFVREISLDELHIGEGILPWAIFFEFFFQIFLNYLSHKFGKMKITV